MFKRKIVRMTKAEFDTVVRALDRELEARKNADERAEEYRTKMYEYHEQLRIEQAENNHLVRENEHLRILFDKESDTEVIKYNGKLYRATSTINQKDETGETLDVSYVCVGEVK